MFAGFDLGANFGYAVLDDDGNRVVSGTWEFGKRTPESTERVYEALLELFEIHLPVIVGYEKVNFFHRGIKAAHAYGTYESILWLVSRKYKVVLEQFTVNKIKKVATGFGNAEKDEMEAAAMTRWAHIPGDDNEADALWIAECARLGFLGSV